MTARTKGLALTLAAFALGCGGASPPTALRAFEVTAFLTPTNAASANLPQTSTFTVAFDAGHMIAGGTGQGKVVPVTSTDGKTFKTTSAFSVGVSSGAACPRVLEIGYDSLEISVSATALQGKATGRAVISCGDCVFAEAFSATLTGAADMTEPSLVAGPGVTKATPFDGFALLASKPLAATSTARLVAEDGSLVDLVADVVDGTPPLVVGFHKPEVVLRPGDAYVVSLDGLVDFAGRRGSSDTPLRLTPFQAAPVVPEDGFESSVGPAIGGATLVRGGPLAPITGTTSAYVGRPSSPSLGGVAPGSALAVRLALQPGDSKLRFAYRVVSVQEGVPFSGSLRVASVGGSPGEQTQLPAAPIGMADVLPGSQAIFASPVKTFERALPAGARGELFVTFAPFDTTCGAPLLGPGAAVLIDDLRVE